MVATKLESLSVFAAILSAFAAFYAADSSRDSSRIARDALEFSQKTAMQTQRGELFAQFQEQYNGLSSRFPARLLDRSFRPRRGSDEYARLEAYWFFCFSEWYATNRVNPDAFSDLWRNYYTPLIADGLEIPSLRYVLEDRIRSRGVGRGEWKIYLRELADISRQYGRPLSPDVEARLRQA